MTQAAANGKLDPVIGREDEIRRCMQILSRRTKNNPVLAGPDCAPWRGPPRGWGWAGLYGNSYARGNGRVTAG